MYGLFSLFNWHLRAYIFHRYSNKSFLFGHISVLQMNVRKCLCCLFSLIWNQQFWENSHHRLRCPDVAGVVDFYCKDKITLLSSARFTSCLLYCVNIAWTFLAVKYIICSWLLKVMTVVIKLKTIQVLICNAKYMVKLYLDWRTLFRFTSWLLGLLSYNTG